MQFKEVKIHHVASTYPDPHALDAYLESVGAPEWRKNNDAPSLGEMIIEFAGRLCYRAFKPLLNKNVTKIRDSNRKYIDNIIKSGHFSVTEHVNDSFIIECTRVATHELVRHRHGSYSQESLRYVRLDELSLYYPDVFKDHPKAGQILSLCKAKVMEDEQWLATMYDLVGIDNLDKFDIKKKLTSAVRRFAPDGLMTSIYVTANLRNWRHTIALRTSRHSEEEIRKIFALIYSDLSYRYPNVFADATVQNIEGIPEITFAA